VVCASCGQTTTVPFEPRGDRPVYCKSCYRPKQGGGGAGGGGHPGCAYSCMAAYISQPAYCSGGSEHGAGLDGDV
jgi:CxxC-x17-CxxC domain-containing protein